MNRSLILLSFACLAAQLALPSEARSQSSRALQQQLENATRLDCSFSTLGTANWETDGPTLTETPSEFEASFFDLNVDEGTAEADSRFGASYIVVRYANGYLHLMQMFNAGPLYVTTILAREVSDGRLMAIHTRHEFNPVVLPGFTSRPEIYLGDCAVSDEPAAN